MVSFYLKKYLHANGHEHYVEQEKQNRKERLERSVEPVICQNVNNGK